MGEEGLRSEIKAKEAGYKTKRVWELISNLFISMIKYFFLIYLSRGVKVKEELVLKGFEWSVLVFKETSKNEFQEPVNPAKHNNSSV